MSTHRTVVLVKRDDVEGTLREFPYSYTSMDRGIAVLRAWKRFKNEYPNEDWTVWHVQSERGRHEQQ